MRDSLVIPEKDGGSEVMGVWGDEDFGGVCRPDVWASHDVGEGRLKRTAKSVCVCVRVRQACSQLP